MPNKLEMLSSIVGGRRVGGEKARPELRASVLRRTRRIRPRNVSESAFTCWSKSDQLAIQLLLDPHLMVLRYQSSLSYSGREIPIEMFIADLDDGERVAFDLLNERPYRDIDAEGLLLLALRSHRINLIEIDYATIDAEPRASNTRWLWSFREHRVPSDLRAAVDQALTSRRRLTIHSVGKVIGSRDPMPTIGALVSQGVLAIDPSQPIGLHSIIGRRSDRWPTARRLNWFGKVSQ